MKIFYNNKIYDSILTPSSSFIGQNVENLKVPQLAKTFTFNGNDESLVVDLENVENIKSFIVDRGNLTPSAVLTLEANTTGDWSAPAFTIPLIETESSYYNLFDESYRWWRLRIDDSTITNVTIGFIHMTETVLQMPGIDPEVDLEYNTTSESSFSVSGQVFGNTNYGYLQTAFEFPMIYETSIPGPKGIMVAGRKGVLDLWKTVENNKPFWVFLWENNLDEYAPVFCVLNQSSLIMNKKERGRYYSTIITLREVK